jgi:hypothetical protein
MEGFLIALLSLPFLIITIMSIKTHRKEEHLIPGWLNCILFSVFMAMLLCCLICHTVFYRRVTSNNLTGYDCSDPITYEIIRNQNFNSTHTNLLTGFTTRQDENGVYYKTSNVLGTYNFGFANNEVDQYTIKVNYPISYKDHPEYQGSVELFSIIINATQVA